MAWGFFSFASARAFSCNTYTKFEGGKLGETYLLGSTTAAEDWDAGRFTEQFDGFWYTLNGQLVSAELQSQGPYEVLAVPAYIEGEEELCVITALRMASVPESTFYIMGYTIVSPGEGGATRTYSPQGNFTFQPVLTGFDLVMTNSIDFSENASSRSAI